MTSSRVIITSTVVVRASLASHRQMPNLNQLYKDFLINHVGIVNGRAQTSIGLLGSSPALHGKEDRPDCDVIADARRLVCRRDKW